MRRHKLLLLLLLLLGTGDTETDEDAALQCSGSRLYEVTCSWEGVGHDEYNMSFTYRQQSAFPCTTLHLQDLGEGRVKIECPLAPNHVHYYVQLTVTLSLTSNLTLVTQVQRVFYLEKHIRVEAPRDVTTKPGTRQGALRADWVPPDTGGLSVHLVYQIAVTTTPRAAAATAAADVAADAAVTTRPCRSHLDRVKPGTVKAATVKDDATVEADVTVEPGTEGSDAEVEPARDKVEMSAAPAAAERPATWTARATETLLVSRAPTLLLDGLPPGTLACVRVRARPDGASMGGPWGPWGSRACSRPAHVTDLLSLLCFTRDLTSLTCEWRVETIMNLTFTLSYHLSVGSIPCAPDPPESQFASCSIPPAAITDLVRAELRADSWDSTWNLATWGPALLRHAVRTDPPGHVTVHPGRSSGTLHVTWSSPDPVLTNHLRYEIGYADAVGEAHWKVVPVEASTQLDVSGLSPGRHYRVRARTQPSSFLYRGSWSGWSRTWLGTASPQHDMRSWSPYLGVVFFIAMVGVILFVTRTKLQRLKARLCPPVSAIDLPLNRLMSEFSNGFQGCSWEGSPAFPGDVEVAACSLEVLSEVNCQWPLLHPSGGLDVGGDGGNDVDDGHCRVSAHDPLATPKVTAIRRAVVTGARKRMVDSGFSEGDTASDSGESDVARANVGESDSVQIDLAQPGLAECDAVRRDASESDLKAESFELALASSDLSQPDGFNTDGAAFDFVTPSLTIPDSAKSGLVEPIRIKPDANEADSIEPNLAKSDSTKVESDSVKSDRLNPYWEYKTHFTESNSGRAVEVEPGVGEHGSGDFHSLQSDLTPHSPESSLSEPNTGDPVLSELDSNEQKTSVSRSITSHVCDADSKQVTSSQSDGSASPHIWQQKMHHNALQCPHCPQVWLVSGPEGYVIIPHHLLPNLGRLNPTSVVGGCPLQRPRCIVGLAPSEGDMDTPGYVNMSLQPTT